MFKLNPDGGIILLNDDGSEKKLSQLETIYYQSKLPLTNSDKFLIRLIWKRYCKLYKQRQTESRKGEITQLMKDYPTRRKYYLNMIDELTGNITELELEFKSL